MSLRVEDFHDGKPLSAAALNEIRAESQKLNRITGLPPIYVDNEAGGVVVRYVRPWEGWIKLTSHGTGGKYAWTEQIPAASGAWVAGQATGTATVDPANAANANATINLSPNPIVYAWRNGVGTIVFMDGTC